MLPGIPGQPGADYGLAEGVHPYPESTTDFVKMLRARGALVEYRDSREARAEVGFKAMEIWLPAVLSMLGNLLAIVLWELLDEFTRKYGDPTTTDNVLHVSWEFELPDGTRSTFTAHGPGSQVRESFSEFVQGAGLPAPSAEATELSAGVKTTDRTSSRIEDKVVADDHATEQGHDVDEQE